MTAAAGAAGVSERTVYRWLRRWREEGERDSSTAHRRHIRSHIEPRAVEAIEKLRRLFMTAAEIAEVVGMALSTVSAVLKRIGLGKHSRLSPPEPPRRYERKRPGELVHLDINKIGRISAHGAGHRVTSNRTSRHQATFAGKQRRITGWEFVHVAVDDATRLAYAEVLLDEGGETAAGFLRRAVASFASFGITVERLLSDNGRPVTGASCMPSPAASSASGYGNSAERTAALPGWLTHSNFTRRHGSLSHKPPATRLHELTNAISNYT